jgi:hypothetical protein
VLAAVKIHGAGADDSAMRLAVRHVLVELNAVASSTDAPCSPWNVPTIASTEAAIDVSV